VARPLLAHTPRRHPAAGECYSLTLNVVVLVLLEYFFSRPGVADFVFQTLDSLRTFGGHNSESQAVARAVLTSLSKRLLLEHSRFPNDAVNMLGS
jgi:hypothetical protein